MDGERNAGGIGWIPHISLEPFRKGQKSMIFTIVFTFPQTKQANFWLIPVSLSKFTRHFIWVNRKAIGPTWNGIIVDIDLHQRFKEDMCFVCSRLPQNPTLYHDFPHESGHFWGYTRYFQRHQNIQNSLVKYALVPTVHDEFPCVSPILMINSWLIPVTLANSHGS